MGRQYILNAHVPYEIAHLINRVDAARRVAGVCRLPLDTNDKLKLSSVTQMGLKAGGFSADGEFLASPDG